MDKIKRKSISLLILAVTGLTLLLISACGGDDDSTAEPQDIGTPTATPTVTPTPTLNPEEKSSLAPELTGTQAWINSEPLKIQQLKGKVVLIDFWTYTCINCIRTFPYLKIWHSKYADDGLVIIGVHTPEFKFETELDNVRQAVADYGIGWAVVQDNDYETWQAYDNRFWPAKYLIDKRGVIRYQHFGEGAYKETENKIRDLLEEAGADLSLVEDPNVTNQPFDPEFLNNRRGEITAELYGGYKRNCSLAVILSNSSIANRPYCKSKDKVVLYEDSGEYDKHKLYLQGAWLAGESSLRHGRETTTFEDYMVLRFAAKSVNVVLRPEENKPFKVLATLDGEFLTESNKGQDVVIEKDGRSFLVVDKARLYSVIEAPKYGFYNLKLSSNSGDFAFYAFTFGVYAQGP